MNLKKILIPVLISSFVISCSDFRETKDPQNETPEAFQDKDYISDVSSWKRGYYNVVEELYIEIKEKNEELQNLENEIDQLAKQNYSETKELHKYISNNQNYYNEARNFINSIQDSILKQKIDTILSKSEENFIKDSDSLFILKDTLKRKEQELSDRYSALKIILTLYSIENYRKNEYPDTSEEKDLIGIYESLIESINKKLEN